ncbi:MAG: hypothetical protein ABEK50_07700 [bacterium]
MNEFQEFVWAAFDLTKDCVPKYGHKYSKKTYTQRQLIVMNLIRIKCDWTYRETHDFVQLMTPIRDH